MALANFNNFDLLQSATLNTLRPNSQRVYKETYKLWKVWCEQNDYDMMNLHPENILEFLRSRHVTMTTRQRQYAAMKKLLQIMALTSDTARRAFEYLKLVPLPEENLSDNERETTALTREQIAEVVKVWKGDKPVQIRNYALIWTMVATAMRRAEIVALKWREIDLERGVILVKRGKGNKKRHPAIVYDEAIAALRRWRELNIGEYVFCPMNNVGDLLADEPMSVDNLYRIIQVVKKKSGIELTPHTLRRTLATELILNGAAIPDVQDQLGHAKASTLLDHYVKAADAQQRRKRFQKQLTDNT